MAELHLHRVAQAVQPAVQPGQQRRPDRRAEGQAGRALRPDRPDLGATRLPAAQRLQRGRCLSLHHPDLGRFCRRGSVALARLGALQGAHGSASWRGRHPGCRARGEKELNADSVPAAHRVRTVRRKSPRRPTEWWARQARC